MHLLSGNPIRPHIVLFVITLLLGATLLVPAAPLRAAPITFDDFFSLGRVSDPQISPDGKQVAFVVTRYDKETNKSNSDIFMVPIKGNGVRQLTNSPTGDSQPRFSPDGRLIAFVSSRSGSGQIWLIPTNGGEATQLTSLSTGASGPLWTPDGKHILFTSRVYPDCSDDAANKERLDAADESPVKARIIDDLFYRHWNHWRGERRSHLFIIPVAGGEARDLTPGPYDVPTPALGSGHDYAISPEGKEICVAANTDPMQATSTNNDLFLMSLEDAMNGGAFPAAWRKLTSNPANDNYPAYSPDGRFIAYRSMARPGFEADQYRLIIYDRKKDDFFEAGEELAKTFDRSIGSLTWSPGSKTIYVTCNDLGYSSVYTIDIGKKRAKQLTEKMYISRPVISPNGKEAVFLSQSAAMPYEVFASDRNFAAKKMRNISQVNTAALAQLEMNRLEEFWFDGAGGTPVHGFLLKPPGFTAGKKYPLIFLIHGGPQGMWSDNFHWRWNYQMFAAKGYVVSAINPRGSTGYGQTFTDEISRDWGGKVFEDLMNGLDYLLATYESFIDADRVAAAGASYGGYMINWIEGHNDEGRFKCLVNHDGVYNFTSMYGATEELWFPEWDIGGTPWDNPEEYAQYSPHTYAANFKTPMLVIHSELDYRVPVGEALQVFTALRRQGVPARFLYFPDEDHFVTKPQNAELWWKTVHEWIAQWLQ